MLEVEGGQSMLGVEGGLDKVEIECDDESAARVRVRGYGGMS